MVKRKRNEIVMKCAKCKKNKIALIYYKNKLYCLDCKRKVYMNPTSRGSSPTRKGIENSS